MVGRSSGSGASVLIPWQGGCPYREPTLTYVVERWQALGYTPHIGDLAPDEPWSKASAVQRAVDESSGEILVIADADVWCDGMAHAIEAVAAGASWSVPHRLVHRLTAEASAQVLTGVEPHPGMPLDVLKRPYVGRLGGGVVVLPRSVWGQCSLDRRFIGWGHEDEAWAIALDHIYGPPVRFSSTLYHLWHPPQQRISWGLGSAESDELFKRYHMAATNRDRSEMRDLLAEGRP